MTLHWPWALLGLLVAPAAVAAYVWQLRKRRRQAVRYSSLALIRSAAPQTKAWRRHLPFALLAGALAVLTFGAARPQVHAHVPVSSSAVILALDVSGSMCSTDVDPNRLTAAQDAVRTFVKNQDSHTRVGLVVFSGVAQLGVAPTTDRASLLEAIDGLTTGRGTTIGAAILASIDAIAEIDPNVAPVDSADTQGDGRGATQAPRTTAKAPPVPEIVVLLTDGANTRGITPQDAAVVAASRGIRVYPIGFGTQSPAPMVCTSKQLGGNMFEGFGGGGGIPNGTNGRSPLVADDDALRTVATTTGGEFFKAEGASQLQGVLKNLPRHVQVEQRDIEVSVGFVALGFLLALAAVAAAARWSAFPR